ncbi:uncharacterized protein LOC131630652 [Vicia villosa]|uniref:uncharacterized protein LOC131630652 n=1 Tax=Vicia villosa TaxID=3911 RepID=UPI00273C6B92|nr:uncharacterized protein LOC131630652 [Vicia villosa]
MSARLKRVLGKLVSRCQTAFVPGRSISDGVLMINEVLDMANREKMSCLALKVDFKKAYDCFADDTILVVEGSSDNIWVMKSILRWFEMMSGLRINFHKSRIYGVQVSDWLLEAASNFLSCDIDHLPFKYLGVNFGKSPRKLYMWKRPHQPIEVKVDSVERQLYLNMASRVVLINAVLNAIPI